VFFFDSGDGHSRSPSTTITHTGPIDVCTVVPGAHLAGCALADVVAEPADAIAIMSTVRAGTQELTQAAGDRDRHNLAFLISLSLSLTELARRNGNDEPLPPPARSLLGADP
jgi:hypothetical protein